MLIEIKHRFTGSILFSHNQENNSIRITVELAIREGAYLGGAYLYGADLRGADLQGADLQGADLSGADLSGADLSVANLSDASLYGADLRGADLYSADLQGADLYSADLQGAYLGGAYLYGADLRGADLRGATYGEATLKNGLLQLLGKHWPVVIFDDHIKIGCQFHRTQAWESFSDEQISEMEDNAFGFWRKNKELILTLAKHHQKSGE